jgi:hypothetical protein
MFSVGLYRTRYIDGDNEQVLREEDGNVDDWGHREGGNVGRKWCHFSARQLVVFTILSFQTNLKQVSHHH